MDTTEYSVEQTVRRVMITKWLLAIIVCVLAVPVGAYYALDPETEALDNAEHEHLGGSYIALSDGTTHCALTGPAQEKWLCWCMAGLYQCGAGTDRSKH